MGKGWTFLDPRDGCNEVNPGRQRLCRIRGLTFPYNDNLAVTDNLGFIWYSVSKQNLSFYYAVFTIRQPNEMKRGVCLKPAPRWLKYC